MPEPFHPGEVPGETPPDGPHRRADRRGDGSFEPGFNASVDGDGPDSEAEHPLRQLDPRWVTAERISGAIGATVLSTGALVAVIIFGAGWRLPGLGAWAILTAILFTGAIAGPAMQYRRARYRVTPFGIEIRWGILWRRITIVPRSRIQHTDVEQGPLLRRFGLAKLVIHTAGTEHSTVPVYGLPMPGASAIRDELMGRPAQPPPADDSGLPGPPGAAGAPRLSGTDDGI